MFSFFYISLAGCATPQKLPDFAGTFKGEMKGFGGRMIQPPNKKFRIEFCTVAHWKGGKITEERLFYDLMGMTGPIGAPP
ncbi:ester cyclase [Candidatus Nitrososphaera evergladensis]